jgi:hypothetical protein
VTRHSLSPAAAAGPISDLTSNVKKIQEEIKRGPTPIEGLPCGAHLPDVTRAAVACDAADGTKSCNRWWFEDQADRPFCAIEIRKRDKDRKLGDYRSFGNRIQRGGVGKRIAARLLEAQPYRFDSNEEPLPTIDLGRTDALGAVDAFMLRERTSVILAGTRYDLTGSEWVLVLASPVGGGKSLAAATAIGKVGGQFVSAPDLESLAYDVAGLERDGLLVLDDLGCEHAGASGFVLSRIEKLIAARYAGDQMTIITTNLRRPDFAARYGLRVDDRLREGGIYVELRVASLRGSR